jgi:hypothetical protein
VEAQRQLLVDGAVRVEENVCGVAVNAGEPGERNRHAGLFGDLADHGLHGGFTDLDAASR